MKTVLIGTIHQDAVDLLSEKTELAHKEKIESSDAEAIIIRTYTQIGEEELRLLPNLKYVVSCSVGLDNIDINLLNEKKIELIHCPGTNANAVAEHTIYLMLSIFRKGLPAFELQGKTVGIIGFGYIGKLVARKLQGFDCSIIAYDVIEQDPHVLKQLNVTMKSMEECAKADVVTIHVPLNKYTKGLIGKKFFDTMKPTAFFINTSRAEVIDESALENVTLRGVAADVYSKELKLTVPHILTHHIAAQGEDSFREMCVQPIQHFLKIILKNDS